MSLKCLDIGIVMFNIIGTQILWMKTLPDRAIHFISQKRKLGSILTNQHAKYYSFESLGVKQRKAFDIIIGHYRSGIEPLCMIIQGTAGTWKSYLIGAIKNSLEIESLPEKSAVTSFSTYKELQAFNISATTIHSALHIPIK
jgi:hypothetical protein